MEGVALLSKFKKNLGDVIVGFKNKVSDIENEENFLQVLSDLVNYSRNDCLLLPFYNDILLERVLERVFPVFSSYINKVKAAKYLIEASKDVDKSQFLQYNNAVNDLKEINDKIISFYDDLMVNNTYVVDKAHYNSLIEKYSVVYNLIGDDSFVALIDDVPLFNEVINSCGLSLDDIDGILNIAIRANLFYLSDNGFLDVKVNTINDKVMEGSRNFGEVIDSSL